MDSEKTFIIGACTVLIVLFVCMMFSAMNHNQHYYASMDKCMSYGGTWIPSTNTGICLMNGVIIND